MALPDVSKFIGVCKDYLHAEWGVFKKSNDAIVSSVCIYNICYENDIPNACLDSVSKGIKELESVVKETFDLSVSRMRPIVEHELMVQADGHIAIYPERKNNPKKEPVANTSRVGLPSQTIGQKKPPQTPESAFMGGVEQVANYMMDHLKRISETSLLAGNVRGLYLTHASASLVKSRVLFYKQIFKAPTTKALTTALNRCDEAMDLMTDHLLNFHNDFIRSAVLHDALCHNWGQNQSYCENEKSSLCIQMWSYYMQGIRNDMWRYMSPKAAESLLTSFLSDALSLLVTRYTNIEPSLERMPQYRADVAAILFVTASFLPSIVSTPEFLFVGTLHQTPSFTLHRRADLLVRISTIKSAPIEILAKVYSHGIYASKRRSVNLKDPTSIVSCPEWMTFFNPDLFPSKISSLSSVSDSAAVYLVLLVAASRPFIDQGLITRGLLMRNQLGAKTILKGLQSVPGKVNKGGSCMGALCLSHLCAAPLLPHTVYAAIIQIILKCCSSQEILIEIMRSGMEETVNWDSFDRTQVWNIQRPPWHHALVQQVALKITGVIAQVLQAVPPQPPAQPAHPSQLSVRLEHHLSAWTLQLIAGVEQIADTFPTSVIHIAHIINDLLPSTVKPVGGHVISQCVINAMYSIVNSRKSLDQLGSDGPITDGQWDMMVAVGERLCMLHESNYDSHLNQMTRALMTQLSVEDEEEDDNVDDYTNEGVISSVCREFADSVVSTVQGQHSFGILWEFLKRNMGWVSYKLEAPPLLCPIGASDGRKKEPELSFADIPNLYNPLHNYNHLFYNDYNQLRLVRFEGDWESVLDGDLWLPKEMIKDLISKRPEMQTDAALTPSQADAVRKLKVFIK